MKGSMYTQVIIMVNIILKHIDASMILARYEAPCMIYIGY